MRTVAIIQARMGSTRLPGKVMADLAGEPLLARVVERAQRAKHLDLVAVATTDGPTDEVVARLCESRGIPVFRGSEQDVLDRYYRAAACFDAGVVVRLTADCPLLDAAVIDHVVGAFQAGGYDYVSNTIRPTYPDGLDTEVIRRAALEKAWRAATLTSEREHVTPYIWKRPAEFRLLNVEHDTDLSALRWTVDEPQDLEFVRAVYRHFGSREDFGMKDVLKLLRERPQMQDLNREFERNEGYQKSLREDAGAGGKDAR